MIAAAVTPLLANRSVECVNLVRRITKQHDYFDPNIIKVVIKLNSNPGLEDWIAAQREPRLVLSSGASVFQDVKSVDVVLAGNSSVLSDAVTAGRPSGYVVDLDHGPHDLHRFVECGLICSMEDESGSFRWNPDLMLRFYQRPGWLNVLRYLRILMRMRILSACERRLSCASSHQSEMDSPNETSSNMAAGDVLDLYNALQSSSVEIWLDGGWGVDALLEKQTRSHKDLDIAIQRKDVATLLELLDTRGYREIKLEIRRPHNFVLADNQGHEIDIHVIVMDEHGNGIYGPVENGEMYPAEALAGVGIIAGQPVKCISPEWAINFHSGYELKEKDYKDVSALCEKFGINLPPAYERFRE